MPLVLSPDSICLVNQLRLVRKMIRTSHPVGRTPTADRHGPQCRFANLGIGPARIVKSRVRFLSVAFDQACDYAGVGAGRSILM